ncbi:hypothetical protein VTJ04DRAFT_8754 [Mycothermus thermophilus]|uniref:uncharacterized protein n=1 Tax=Humicola insolens TaxID=85995 RepID=UPI00374360EB
MTNDLVTTGIAVTVVAQGNVAVTPGPFRGCRDASPDPTPVTLFGGGAFFLYTVDGLTLSRLLRRTSRHILPLPTPSYYFLPL